MSVVELMRQRSDIECELTEHNAAAKRVADEMAAALKEVQSKISLATDGIDYVAIDLAKTVIQVRGDYATAGTDRKSVIDEALDELTTGRIGTYSLNTHNLGTKSFDRWHGQRCDCTPMTGPRHGHIVFSVGLTREARERGGLDTLTNEEREAAVYYLIRLEAVQAALKNPTN